MKRNVLTPQTLVTVAEFDRHMTPVGHPLLLRGWTNGWRATTGWTFDFFKESYGNDRVKIAADMSPESLALEISLGDYIDYILDGAAGPVDKVHEALGSTRPFYCYSYKPFQLHPELLEDFALPPFVLDWFSMFDPAFASGLFPGRQGWILLGKEGAVAPLHQDAYHTLTWLAQIRGRKRCYLFSPLDSARLYAGDVDPADPDFERYPLLRDATVFEASLEPGEMLFLPANWWHHVVTEESSITVSYNIVNHINFGYYVRRAFGKRLPAFLGSLALPSGGSPAQ